jgi:hypothetical protein
VAVQQRAVVMLLSNRGNAASHDYGTECAQRRMPLACCAPRSGRAEQAEQNDLKEQRAAGWITSRTALGYCLGNFRLADPAFICSVQHRTDPFVRSRNAGLK